MILIKKLKYNLKIALILVVLCSSLFSITVSHANPKEISWDDLIPWTAVLNPSEVKFNEKLNNKEVKIPGYIIPLEYEGLDIKTFLLVPYIGACIHVPPPPPNQIVYVDTKKSWEGLNWWEPVYVTGIIKIESRQMQFFEMVDIGYEILAGDVEYYREQNSENSFFFW
tara:strand:+ start:102 stop:605 length:504 start_codon:yes stop_codon:yes gene_type:complete